jgi:Fic family protein
MKLLPFNDFDLKTPRILETLNDASRSLAELKGFANSISNQQNSLSMFNEIEDVLCFEIFDILIKH